MTVERIAARPERLASRWYRPTMFGLAAVLLALAAWDIVITLFSAEGRALLASDVVEGYLIGAQRFVDTGSPYSAAQVAGPWELEYHSFIHPPSALVLFVPFLVLPLFLWWVVPIGFTAWCVWRLRPAPWTWPLMAACLLWPRTTGSVLTGNTDIWAMAFVAAAAFWGWSAVALAIKPTVAPLALVAVRRPSAWIAAVVGGVAVVLTLPLWLEWTTVIRNSDLNITYGLLNLPLVMLPAIAWVGRSRPASAAGG